MKILISFHTDIIPANKDNCQKWNVDQIMAWGSDLDNSLSTLPFNEHNIVFLIPTVTSSENALAYDGANLALRILFKYLCEGNCDINIVLLGIETLEAFLCHYDYPSIIKLPGVSYRLFNQYIVNDISYKKLSISNTTQYKPYLTKLGITLPSSFKSTHSMTNEWSLYKWNSYMGFYDPLDAQNLNSLYFDYIKVIEKLNRVRHKNIQNNPDLLKTISALKKRDTKILLIDDNSRWNEFFKNFFKDSNIKFEYIGDGFKRLCTKDIIGKVRDTVNSFSPDVILLDFRLLEDIDSIGTFNEISGTKVLKELKGKFDNPGHSFGRQILIFTATSRIENILKLKSHGADGFILKEKPEQYSSKVQTNEIIREIVKNLISAVDRAKFLIPFNKRLTILASLISNPAINVDEIFKASVLNTIASVRLSTQNNTLDESTLKLVFLNLFAILERLKQDKSYLYSHITSLSSKLNLDNETFKLWEMICDVRRALAHGDTKLYKDELKGKELSLPLLVEWTNNLCIFINEFLKLYLTIPHS